MKNRFDRFPKRIRILKNHDNLVKGTSLDLVKKKGVREGRKGKYVYTVSAEYTLSDLKELIQSKVIAPEAIKYTLDMSKREDVQKLDFLFDECTRTNRVFTVKFYKKSGEFRVMKAIHKRVTPKRANGSVESIVKGTGTVKHGSKYLRNTYDIYKCYEVELTAEEKMLVEGDENIEPKVVKKYKMFYISNVTYIKLFGIEYEIKNNKFTFNDGVKI